MALAIEIASLLLIGTGCVFFVAGTIGLLRFPDLFTGLHALSKADNLGLGLVVIGLLPSMESYGDMFKLLLVWGLSMFAASTTCHLIARKALRTGARPWT